MVLPKIYQTTMQVWLLLTTQIFYWLPYQRSFPHYSQTITGSSRSHRHPNWTATCHRHHCHRWSWSLNCNKHWQTFFNQLPNAQYPLTTMVSCPSWYGMHYVRPLITKFCNNWPILCSFSTPTFWQCCLQRPHQSLVANLARIHNCQQWHHRLWQIGEH